MRVVALGGLILLAGCTTTVQRQVGDTEVLTRPFSPCVAVCKTTVTVINPAKEEPMPEVEVKSLQFDTKVRITPPR